jgi:hypothetical protein
MDLTIVEHENIASKIYEFRGIKTMLDSDLAQLYGVKTGNLNKAMKRNIDRFPGDFVFQLTSSEVEQLSRCQNGILKQGKNIKYLPYVYNEYGILTLSSVLNSKIAIEINHKIIKIFVALRKQIYMQPQYELLKQKLKYIESKVEAIDANQKVESKLSNDKTLQLSREVHRFSKILDDFQDTHTVLKKSDMLDNNMKELN